MSQNEHVHKSASGVFIINTLVKFSVYPLGGLFEHCTPFQSSQGRQGIEKGKVPTYQLQEKSIYGTHHKIPVVSEAAMTAPLSCHTKFEVILDSSEPATRKFPEQDADVVGDSSFEAPVLIFITVNR